MSRFPLSRFSLGKVAAVGTAGRTLAQDLALRQRLFQGGDIISRHASGFCDVQLDEIGHTPRDV